MTTNCTYRSNIILCALFVCLFHIPAAAQSNTQDTTPLSSQKQALDFLDKLGFIKQSTHWPNVTPVAFMENLRKNIVSPLTIYEGRSTNFCAYAALSYLPLHDDPLGFVQFMVKIYSEGKALYGKAYFEPGKEVREEAGTLRFKGELDIRPADQLWFFTLADHFKGYLNFFDKHFNNGDENRMWAAVNLTKFNRMIRVLFNYRVASVGSDLFRPGIRDIFEYLSERLQTGNVALFVNNPSLYRKDHKRIKISVPTHFIILLNVEEVGDKIAFTYWDYGGRTMQLFAPSFLKKIIFGVSHITKKTNGAN